MYKIDHRKALSHLYHPSADEPTLVDVPTMNFLMFDGQGKPNGSAFQQAADTLYPLAYIIKFIVRDERDVDYHVMPMEVCWRINRETREFAWTMMLMQPDYVTPERVAAAREKARAKVEPALLEQVRFEPFNEGTCIQLRHIGPYQGMDAALERMVASAEAQGYLVPARDAHDIYLNDVRKTRPENLQAVMRLPVVRKTD